MTLPDLISLYRGVSDEAEDILEKVSENGRTTLKPGSPALAVLYGYEELARALFQRIYIMEKRVQDAIHF